MSNPATAHRGESAFFKSPPPAAALEIAANRVAAVSLSGPARELAVAAYAIEPLDAGVVTPALNAPNVHDEAALTATIRSAMDKVSSRARRIALVLPDIVAKVSILKFEKVPAKVHELEQLIRWQVRKAAPFRVEDAQVTWIAGAAPAEGGREFIVTVARRDIIESYERVCEAAGLHAGLIDIATFSLVNAQLAGERPAGDWLLVHVAADYVTLAVIRGDELVSFRNRGVGDGDLTEMVHQTAMYHEDRLGGGGFSRVVLSGAAMAGSEQAGRLRRGLEERLGGTVSLLDVRAAAALRDRIDANAGLLDALAAPAGALLREYAGSSGQPERVA